MARRLRHTVSTRPQPRWGWTSFAHGPNAAATRLRWVSDPMRITTPTGLRLVLSQQRAQVVLKSDGATIAAYGVNSAATPLGLDLFRTWTQRCRHAATLGQRSNADHNSNGVAARAFAATRATRPEK